MKKMPKVLFAIKGRGHTGTLIKPEHHLVLQTDRTVHRIVLAPSIEEAIYLTFPRAYKDPWTMAKIKIYAIEPCGRHPIVSPEILMKNFGFDQAVEHNEYACFSNLRMKSIGMSKLIRESKLNIDLVDESGNVYGKRYHVF